jgi:hypothetical protein
MFSIAAKVQNQAIASRALQVTASLTNKKAGYFFKTTGFNIFSLYFIGCYVLRERRFEQNSKLVARSSQLFTCLPPT